MSVQLPQQFRIADRGVGSGEPCFVIAEAGLNHNGDLEMAKRLVDISAAAGADAVKFQKRTVDILATREVLDAPDDRFPEFGSTYREIREHLEFDRAEYQEIERHCRDRGIIFLCTAFDIPAADFLEDLVPAYKVASHGLTNLPLLEHLAGIGKPVIVSTGMCMEQEIDDAVAPFVRQQTPLALMHCVSSYPQPVEDSNLAMLDRLRQRYQVPVGYSGHEIGTLPTLAAVARGAELVERHVTLDRTLPGFDHKLSLEPQELTAMVRDIRLVESAIGTGAKGVSEREMITRRKYHVSVVAAREIPAGTVITGDMLALKNPGTGLPARELPELIGRTTKRSIPADTLLDWEMLSPDAEPSALQD